MSKKLLVRYKNKTFDMTKFVEKHPGGQDTLWAASNSDIDNKFDIAVPHSAAAKYLLKDIFLSDNVDNNVNDHNGDAARKRDDRIHIDHTIKMDESMEHLVDWSRGMFAQVGNLKSNYMEWINKPVDRPLRLFDSAFLEMFSKGPFWVIPCYWIPIIVVLVKISLDNNAQCSMIYILMHVGFGIFLWTFIEYFIHRWIFHMNVNTDSRFACTFHFLIHGIHHKVPFDPDRLVFPLVPASIMTIILSSLFYILISRFTHHPLLVEAGALIGYVTYDLIHYYTHFGNPSIKHLRYMKRYHYQHHFVHEDIGFGVSSSLWDRVFNTLIILRKLNYYLK